MSEKRDNFPKQILGSLFSPRKTFESIKGRDLRRGLLVILIVGVLSALASYNYSSKLPIPQLPNMPQNGAIPNQDLVRTNFMIIRGLGGGISVILNWLVLSTIVYLVGKLLFRKGGFSNTLAFMAFASVPLALQHALRLLDSLTASRETLLSLTSSGSLNMTLGGRLLVQSISVFTVFGVWAFVLALIAVSANNGISKKRAFFATILAYLIYILAKTFLPV